MATKDSLRDLLNQMEAFVSTKTVIGEPMQLENMTILPMVDVSLGVGAGSRDRDKYGSIGGAVGAKMSPSAVLVIQDGKVRMVSIKNQDNISKAIDLIPEIIDKVTGKNKEADAKIREAVENQENKNSEA